MKQSRRTAFTIVELLVVISIMALLIGLISSGISAAIGTGKKTKEMNRVKQLTLAWMMYSGQYEDKLLPGFLEQTTNNAGVQSSWGVHYKNLQGDDLDPRVCQTYPWRLAPYLDHNIDAFLGYRGDSQENLDLAVYQVPDLPVTLPASLDGTTGLSGAGTALQPGFGYNAYYLGGWWTTVAGSPSVTFGNDGYVQAGSAGILRGRIVARTLAAILRPSEQIVFSASIFLNQSASPYSKLNEYLSGSAWVVPHRLGADDIWGLGGVTLEGADLASGGSESGGSGSGGTLDPILAFLSPSPKQQSSDIGKLMVFKTQAVPFERYGKSVSIGLADGSTSSPDITELNDIRRWVPCADSVGFTHAP